MSAPHTNGRYPALEEDLCWRALQARDERFDGAFVYAVASTNVFCRPTCSARRPRREQVAFYRSPDAARQAGYRACKRCHPDQPAGFDAHVELARAVGLYIDEHIDEPLTLEDLAREAGVSPAHLQRTFKRAMGITPRQYLRARRVASFKREVRAGQPVTSALYDAGFGSSSRLYESSDAELGMTPATYRRGGRGMTISYTIADSPLGRLLVATTERGVCRVCIGDVDAELEQALHEEYPAAEISRADGELSPALAAILAHLSGEQPRLELPVDVLATAFQRRVWEELQRIPYGDTRTYSEVAEAIGKPAAVRAVARACATNPTAIVVPCHRVIGTDKKLHGYRWGLERKRALLMREQTATIFVSDVEASTPLTQRLGDARARELLREHEALVRQALAEHGGAEVKTTGDGFIAAFASPANAVDCAVAVQRAFAQRNETAAEPLRVAIGINTGEPILEDRDLHGTVVIVAARLAELAKGGEILTSDIVRQLVAGQAGSFADQGRVALRGFDQPQRLYEVRWQEEIVAAR